MPRRYRRPYWPEINVPDDVDSKSIREKLGWTQARLARMLGVSVRVVEGWERIRWVHAKPGEDTSKWGGYVWKDRECRPSAAARVLLAMIEKDPWVVFDCLSGQLKPCGQQSPSWLD